MPLKSFKPTSAGVRSMTVSTFEDITTSKPEKSLLVAKKRTGGRNNQGKITTRHRGGGAKKFYRIIDFKRNKIGIPGRVTTIEYDPNRSSRIALIFYPDGEKRYILAPVGLKVGDTINAGPGVEIRVGNAMPLRNVPLGSVVHNIEMLPGRGGQLVRSAGASAQLLARDETYAQIRMPSGEVRLIHVNCMATIGQVGNLDHENESIGKAGRARHMGLRPEVRGTVMNPRDHPHGGGEGRAPAGGVPQTKWGKIAMGLRTRNNKRTDGMIVRKRTKK